MSIQEEILENLKNRYDNPDFAEEQKNLADDIGIPAENANIATNNRVTEEVARIDTVNKNQSDHMQLLINRLVLVADQINALAQFTGAPVPSADGTPLTFEDSEFDVPEPTTQTPVPGPDVSGPHGEFTMSKENIQLVATEVATLTETNNLVEDTTRTDQFGLVINATIGEVRYYLQNDKYRVPFNLFTIIQYRKTLPMVEFAGIVISREVIEVLKDLNYFDNRRFVEGVGWVAIGS